MTEIPKAWLPADTFDTDSSLAIERVLTEVVDTGTSFICKFYKLVENKYELAAEATIIRSTGHNKGVEISLHATKRFQKFANENELEARAFKRSHPTSAKWVKTMLGTPVSHMVANHALSGVMHLIGLESSTAFSFSSPINQIHKSLGLISSNDASLERLGETEVFRWKANRN
jgi:hypothetical protein